MLSKGTDEDGDDVREKAGEASLSSRRSDNDLPRLPGSWEASAEHAGEGTPAWCGSARQQDLRVVIVRGHRGTTVRRERQARSARCHDRGAQ